MKQFILPERMEKVPEKRLIPQTVIINTADRTLQIIFQNDEMVQFVDQDLEKIMERVIEVAKSHEILSSAIIEDIEAQPSTE